MSRRRATRTSRFGSKGRESHDASAFYQGRLYDHAGPEDPGPYLENPVPPGLLDRIIVGDSKSMDLLPDCSVHLMVTSPPYNVGKEYDEDLTLDDYLEMLAAVFRETYRVLVPGGRACVNVANLGRRPYIPLNAHVADVLMREGYLMRGEIIWDKGGSAGVSTAWGSWKSPSNPTLRDVHEYILVFSKGKYQRDGRGRQGTISREQFLEFTKSIWSFPSESASRVGHPAPFPVELPYRLIELYTFRDDVVLDPFMGSGSTAIAALKAGRRYVGYEVDAGYARAAEERIGAFRSELSSALG